MGSPDDPQEEEPTPWQKAFALAHAEIRQQKLRDLGASDNILNPGWRIIAHHREAVSADPEAMALLEQAREIAASEEFRESQLTAALLGQFMVAIERLSARYAPDEDDESDFPPFWRDYDANLQLFKEAVERGDSHQILQSLYDILSEIKREFLRML